MIWYVVCVYCIVCYGFVVVVLCVLCMYCMCMLVYVYVIPNVGHDTLTVHPQQLKWLHYICVCVVSLVAGVLYVLTCYVCMVW